MDFFGTGLLGSLFGGLFRLAPEVLKYFDKKNEREHELKMFTLQTDLEKMRGEFRVEEKYVDHSTAALDAIQAAFDQQGKADERAWKWVASLSALVRPGVTYWLMAVYSTVKMSAAVYAMQNGASWNEVLPMFWTEEDFGLLNLVITFWFVGRAIEKYKK